MKCFHGFHAKAGNTATPRKLSRNAQRGLDVSENSAGFRRVDRINNLKAAEAKRLSAVFTEDGDAIRLQALGSGGLAGTTDDEDEF